MSEVIDIKEQQEKAQIILVTALNRVRAMGFGVACDGTIHGNGIWANELRAEYRGKVLPPLPMPGTPPPGGTND